MVQDLFEFIEELCKGELEKVSYHNKYKTIEAILPDEENIIYFHTDSIFFTKLFFRSFTILKFKIFSSHMVGNCDVSKSQKKKLRKKFNVSSKLIHIQRLDCYAVFNAIHHSWREGEGVRIGFKLRGT